MTQSISILVLNIIILGFNLWMLYKVVYYYLQVKRQNVSIQRFEDLLSKLERLSRQ
jgi:hypothetical protein